MTRFTNAINAIKEESNLAITDILHDMIIAYVSSTMNEEEDLTNEENKELIEFCEWGAKAIKREIINNIMNIE